MKSVAFSLCLLSLGSAAAAANLDVYILAGQSNMDGRALSSELSGPLANAQPGNRIYYANPGGAEDPDNLQFVSGWQPLAPGYSVPPGFSGNLPSNRFGPEVSFAPAISDAIGTGDGVAIIKVARGGTSLRFNWNATGGRPFMYETLIDQVGVALDQLEADGDTVTLRGMLWHQGESDGASLSDEGEAAEAADVYRENLLKLIRNVRQDLGDDQLPFIIGELASTKNQVFRDAQKTVSEVALNAGFANSTGLTTSDDTHFDARSQVLLGQRFAAAAAALIPEPASLALLAIPAMLLGRRRSSLRKRIA